MGAQTFSRRAFLAAVTSTALGCATRTNTARVVPGAISPNEKLHIAMVGAGGRALENLGGVSGENIVALCDVDVNRGAKARADFSGAKWYTDWRRLLDDADSFDAVVVSTPDHTHAPVSVSAMRLGKHVYCEKPLTRSIHEARVMAETAAKYKVATQMGTQGVAEDLTRTGVEMLRSGVVGVVNEIHVWTDRALNWWPQGVERPTDSPPVPENLDWEVWVGTAPMRPYHPAYHPFKWRGWKDFGSGAIGDMGIHNAAIAFLGLNPGLPTKASILETSGLCKETFPAWSRLRIDLPLPDGRSIPMHWYDGGKKPSTELVYGHELDGNGCIVVGSKGVMYSQDWAGDKWFLYPEGTYRAYEPPTPTLPRVESHYAEWIGACKTGGTTMCNFADFAAPMTEIMQLGNLALLCGQDIEWDSRQMKATNCAEAARFVRPEYRKGWGIEGLG